MAGNHGIGPFDGSPARTSPDRPSALPGNVAPPLDCDDAAREWQIAHSVLRGAMGYPV